MMDDGEEEWSGSGSGGVDSASDGEDSEYVFSNDDDGDNSLEDITDEASKLDRLELDEEEQLRLVVIASNREQSNECDGEEDDRDDGPPPLEPDPDSNLAVSAAPASSGTGIGTGLLGMTDDDDESPALGAQPAKPVTRKGMTGLKNLGNTCYVSSSLAPSPHISIPSSSFFLTPS